MQDTADVLVIGAGVLLAAGLQFCHDELSVQMAKYSYKRYMQFEEEIGVSTEFTDWLVIAGYREKFGVPA